MKFEMIVVVWGQTFTDIFADLCLASFLAPGNLPSWPYLNTTTLVIYTQAIDQEKLKQKPAFQVIDQLIKVEWRLIQPNLLLHSHHMARVFFMSTLHRGAINKASQSDTALMIIPPDMILSNQSLSYVAKMISEGKEVVMIAGLRTKLEASYSVLLDICTQEGILDLSSQDCVELFVKFMHDEAKYSFIDSQLFIPYPSHIFQWLPDSTIEAHFFHFHPFIILHPQSMNHVLYSDSVDGDYMQAYEHKKDKIDLGREGSIIEVSFMSETQSVKAYPLTYAQRHKSIEQFAYRNCTSMHRWFFTQDLKLKYNTSENSRFESMNNLV